jgi:predicted nucleotidyltransferase
MLNLEDKYLEELKDILALVLKKKCPARVFVFGSRVKSSNVKKMADIDLALLAPNGPVPNDITAKLADYFSASDIPYRVDIIDLNKISASFKTAIEADLLEISF